MWGALWLPCFPGFRKTRAADSRWWWLGIWGYFSLARAPFSAVHQPNAQPSWPLLGGEAGCGGWLWHKITLILPVSCMGETKRHERQRQMFPASKPQHLFHLPYPLYRVAGLSGLLCALTNELNIFLRHCIFKWYNTNLSLRLGE